MGRFIKEVALFWKVALCLVLGCSVVGTLYGCEGGAVAALARGEMDSDLRGFEEKDAKFEWKYPQAQFSRVEISSLYDIVVRSSSSYQVTLRARQESMKDSLKLSVENGVLTVELGNVNKGSRSIEVGDGARSKERKRRDRSLAQLVVEMPLLDALSVWGVCSVEVKDGLRLGNRVKISLSGIVGLGMVNASMPGDFRFEGSGISEATFERVQVAGNATLEVSGMVTMEMKNFAVGGISAVMDCSGMSSMKFERVECVDLSFDCSGMSKCRIGELVASGDVSLDASGMSSLRVANKKVKGKYTSNASGFSRAK